MNIKKYFWDLNPRALKETESILKNPHHPLFAARMTAFLSRCDRPGEVFSVVSKKHFVEKWPDVRRYWIKRKGAEDFRLWWENMYEELSRTDAGAKPLRGAPSESFKHIGNLINEKRVQKGLTQRDLAYRTRMSQPDISAIERGHKNITLDVLFRLGKVLGIKEIPLAS